MTSTEEKLARELGAQMFLPEGALPRDSWEAFARRLWRKCLELTEQVACVTCKEIGDGFGPSHNGSKNCESGSIASGGTIAHCTCDVCF